MSQLPKILCVDDEINVLEGLKLHLRKLGQVLTANSGSDGLKILSEQRDIAVVISDMRMPSMDGATFLSTAREFSPDSVRILLTGFADVEAAVSAVNKGQLFRFLTKPCPPEQLQLTVNAALEQHRLITAEKELLQKTLVGAIRALAEVLALANPIAMGRAIRLKERVRQAAKGMDIPHAWQTEIAAIFSQLSAISLPDSTRHRIYDGEDLTEDEKKALARNIQIINNIVSNIPRLEPVTDILKHLVAGPNKSELPQAGLLRAIIEIDHLETRGATLQEAFEILGNRSEEFDADLLSGLKKVFITSSKADNVKEVVLSELENGMTILEDLYTQKGVLIMPRGFVITDSSREHILGFSEHLNKTVKVQSPVVG